MRSRESQSSDCRFHKITIFAAVICFLLITLTAAFFYVHSFGRLVLTDARTGEQIAAYRMKPGDEFGIGFIHSVNKSPVTDYYEVRRDGIYVVRTVYYGFGAGVQTELEEGQKLEYSEDGSMIITGFNRKMEDLVYFVGTVSDHTLTLGSRQISLRDLCGRNAMVRFSYEMWM